MELLFQCCLWAITGILCTILLQKNAPEISFLLAVAISAGIGLVAVSILRDIFTFINELASFAKIDPEVITPICKTVVIAVVTKISADLCRDAKETAVASAVELAGTCAGIYVVLPLINSVLRLVSAMV